MTSTSTGAEHHTIDGLHVVLSGPPDAPPLLFGHSLLFDGRMWESQVAALQSEYRCVNVDFRGHGASAAPPRGFTIVDQAEDYRKALDALGIASAIVVGTSMGAMAGMHLAQRHPSRVRALACLNTSADRQIGRPRLAVLGALARVVGLKPFLRKVALAEMFSARFRAERPEVIALWDERFASLEVIGAVRALTMVIDRPDALAAIATLRVPTMVVAGEADVATPPALGRRIVERVPGAEWQLLPCGHSSAIEEPEAVTALVRAFAQRVLRA